uniref:BTB domain-containing protein n=1 Tax=Panagrellus redivivus TaxID=6233 RepID=A0A7E4VDZ6_PANRE
MPTPIKREGPSPLAQKSLSIDKQPSPLAGPVSRFRRPGHLALPSRASNALSSSAPGPSAGDANGTVSNGPAGGNGGLTPEVVSKTSPWKAMSGNKASGNGRSNTGSGGGRPANHLIQRSFSTIDSPPRFFGRSMPVKLSTGSGDGMSPGIFSPKKISLPQEDRRVMHNFAYGMAMGSYQYTMGPNEIDFTQPDPSRPLEIRCCGNSIYVNPEFAQDVSPLFTNFLVREFVAGKQKCVDMQRDDINFPDIIAIARALCPCELGIFPIPVDASSFIQLARLSWDLNIEKLKTLCDLYISKMALDDPDLTNDEMCDFLGAAYQYRLSKWTRVRLLECVVGREVNFLTPALNTTNLLPELVCAAVKAYKEGSLGHNHLTNDVKLKVCCRTCRVDQPPVPLAAIKGDLSSDGIPSFVKCGQCRTTICCGCILRPCEKQIEEFVTTFCKDNQERIQLY